MTEKRIDINRKLKLNFYLLMLSVLVAAFLSGPDLSSMPLPQWIASNLFIAMFGIIPLLFFIPTVRKPNPRNVSWLGFFLLAFLLWAIVLPMTLISHLLLISFTLSTFIYSIIWLRPFKKAAKAQKQAQEKDSSAR